MKDVHECASCPVMSNTLQPWDFPGKKTGVNCHSPGDLPNPGIELASPASPALASRFFTTDPPGKQDNDYFSALDPRMVAYPL